MNQGQASVSDKPSRPPAGVYVHWPFCEHKCPYCDFYSFGRESSVFSLAADYARALVAEIATVRTRLGIEGRPGVDTIYFGGGTPSLMPPDAMAAILGTLREVFVVAPNVEMTMEVNPTTAEMAALGRYLALGVNRLSIGCQSFNARILHELGRVHDAETTRRAIEHIRALGVTNLSLDIIFGAPTQTLDDLRRDVEAMLAFAPAHISAYGMTIHEGTPYFQRRHEGRLALPPEEAHIAMYEHLVQALPAAGYGHYEISNWARPGMDSRHNRKYWRDCDVFSFGVAAHGVCRGLRSENPPDIEQYLDLGRRELNRPIAPPESERGRLGEIMMLALRRVEGVAWAEIDAWAGRDVRAFYAPELVRLGQAGLLVEDGQTLHLGRRGLLLADMVMEEFF